MKIAVTGGTGFIGRYVVKQLLEDGYTPIIISRKSDEETTYTDYSVKSLIEIFKDIDGIIHLAASRGSQGLISEFHPNEVISQNIFEAARNCNITNIVNLSTISVYGNIEELPWTELSSVKPSLMYGVSKHAIENISNIYSTKYDLNIKNIRLAHVFGFNEKNNYMINKFMRQAYLKKPLSLETHSIAKREFIYTKDAAKGIVAALNCDKPLNINLGSGINLTNEEVASNINDVFENKGNIRILDPNAKEKIESSYMLSERAYKELCYTPDYTFKQALQEIYNEMKGLKYVPELY